MLTIEINQTKASRIWLTTAGRRHYPHDKPAITHWLPNGQKHYEAYYLNHQYHRTNGKPAITYWYGNGQRYREAYYLNHQYHRTNGKPAITYWYGNGQRYRELYYLNGTQYIPRKTTC